MGMRCRKPFAKPAQSAAEEMRQEAQVVIEEPKISERRRRGSRIEENTAERSEDS